MMVRLGRREEAGDSALLHGSPLKVFPQQIPSQCRAASSGWFLLQKPGRNTGHLGGCVKGRRPSESTKFGEAFISNQRNMR